MSLRAFPHQFLSPALLALLISGCTETTPTSPNPLMASHEHRALAEVPFHLRGDAVLEAQIFAPGFPADASDFGGRCSVPSHFVISFSLTGQATHLGDVSALLEHCTQLDLQTGLFSISDGEMVVTAANGDELWTRSQQALGGEEHHEFVGGTGRFVEASGGAVAHAECDRAAGTCVVAMDGVIVYAASDRSR
jgi:hypothetical protein